MISTSRDATHSPAEKKKKSTCRILSHLCRVICRQTRKYWTIVLHHSYVKIP
uniref:Uncharacterized protein n=1 Tax=Rhizophora mucronata TaxID=61149 RepID=A0A2P2K0Y0_RHIMU